jgi:hypothetical protein
MSATIWLEIEAGSDRAPVRTRHEGYWSGNQRDRVEKVERHHIPVTPVPELAR